MEALAAAALQHFGNDRHVLVNNAALAIGGVVDEIGRGDLEPGDDHQPYERLAWHEGLRAGDAANTSGAPSINMSSAQALRRLSGLGRLRRRQGRRSTP